MNSQFLTNLSKARWYHMGGAMIFSAGLLLLFVDKLPSKLRDYLLPALIVSGIGAVFLGYIEASIFHKNSDQMDSEKILHPYKRFYAANGALFVFFIMYLLYRDVL